MTDYPVFHRPPRPIFTRRPGGQTPSLIRAMTRTLANGTYGSIGVGSTGTDYYPLWEFEDIAAAQAVTIPAEITRVNTRYYSALTQLGGASYKRVASQPAHDLAWQDASGAWFEFDGDELRWTQAGVVGGGADDTEAMQKAFAYCSLTGKTMRGEAFQVLVNKTLSVTSGFRLLAQGQGDANGTSETGYLCSIKWSAATVRAAITGISQANPGVVTYSGSHIFTNGMRVGLKEIVGMDVLNDREVVVANVNTGASTFQMVDAYGSNIDTSSFTAYESGGYAYPATYIIQIKSATASESVFDFYIDGVALRGDNKVYGGINFASTRGGGFGALNVDRCRGVHARIDTHNLKVNAGGKGELLVMTAGSNAACDYAVGLLVDGAEQGCTQWMIESISSDTQANHGIILGDIDGSTFGKITGSCDTGGGLSITSPNPGVDPAITQANPGVVYYSGSDTLTNGMRVMLTGIVGMTQLNNLEVVVSNLNTGANSFELKSVAGTNIDTTNFTEWSSGGTITPSYHLLYLRGEPASLPAGQTRGNTRSARKNVFRFFNGDSVYAEAGSKNVIEWVNSEGTTVNIEADAVLDYSIIHRKKGYRFRSRSFVLDDKLPLYFTSHNGYAITGSPADGTIGGQGARIKLFDATTTESWQWTFRVPPHWFTGRFKGLQVHHVPTASETGKYVVYQVGAVGRAAGTAFGASLDPKNFTVAMGPDAGEWQEDTLLLDAPVTVGRGNVYLIRFSRVGGDAADTFGSDVGIIDVFALFEADAVGGDGNAFRYLPSPDEAAST